MKFKWTDALLINHEKIDNQHKELINRLNKVYTAISEEQGSAAIEEMLDFLANYVIEHFQEEERQMDRYQYPEAQKHKGEHVAFIDDFERLKKKYEVSDNKYQATLDIYSMCALWLQNHITKVDKKLGQFLAKQS